MFEYIVFRAKKRAFQLLCNFIPSKALRVRTRNALYERYCQLPNHLPDLHNKVFSLSEVDRHLPRRVLAKIKAFENEYFAAQNAKIQATAAAVKNAEILAILNGRNSNFLANLSQSAEFALNSSTQNAQILANAHANERERERESKGGVANAEFAPNSAQIQNPS